MASVGSPATTEKTPSDAPTEKEPRSAARCRIVSPADRRVEGARRLDVRDPDHDVIDVPLRAPTAAVHRFEAVARAVLEKRRVVILGVMRTEAGASVVHETGLNSGACKAIDV